MNVKPCLAIAAALSTAERLEVPFLQAPVGEGILEEPPAGPPAGDPRPRPPLAEGPGPGRDSMNVQPCLAVVASLSTEGCLEVPFLQAPVGEGILEEPLPNPPGVRVRDLRRPGGPAPGGTP